MTLATMTVGNRTFFAVPERDFECLNREIQLHRELIDEDIALGKNWAKEVGACCKSGGQSNEAIRRQGRRR